MSPRVFWREEREREETAVPPGLRRRKSLRRQAALTSVSRSMMWSSPLFFTHFRRTLDTAERVWQRRGGGAGSSLQMRFTKRLRYCAVVCISKRSESN